jgi:glycosyltransferase involved in cell wall biosynthesis
MPKSVSVLISNYNHSRFIKALVDQIAYSQLVYPKRLEVIITDSGSDLANQVMIHGMLEEYREVLRMKYVCLDKSAERAANPRFNGYAFCVNVGAQQAAGDVLIHCDSSILIPPTYLEALASPHMERDQLFVRAGLCNIDEKETRLCMAQKMWERGWNSIVAHYKMPRKKSLGRPAWSVTKKAFEVVGGMDESMQTYGAIDDDFVTRLMMSGYNNVEADIYVIHQFHTEDRKNDGVNEGKMHKHCRERTTTVETSSDCDKVMANWTQEEYHSSWRWIHGEKASDWRRFRGQVGWA